MRLNTFQSYLKPDQIERLEFDILITKLESKNEAIKQHQNNSSEKLQANFKKLRIEDEDGKDT
jgi:hypothetical protein